MLMKKGLLAATILTISCSTAAFAHEHHQNEACGATTLHGYMEDIKDEMRAMSSDIKSGDNQAAAARVETLIAHFEKSRDQVPYKLKAEKLEGADLKEQMSNYEKGIDKTIDVFKNLEVALKSDDLAEVKKWLGEIGAKRQQGHQAFKANC
ncbi:hypothetical protein J9B83_13565 [Marinomonas sp. A79]|uniref:Cytochrome b562 n=1 Tax=Marinomonas vulgaris TaxID=2823372 RepID=A0ABS5HE59_9GAMM|nr:cytochrome b562 [Marinomonas vulgaris]MBR7889941.1 hypothetical protein [Marinomonas vulgaris]